MKTKNPLSPILQHKTPTTPVRSARSNTQHQKPASKSNISINFKSTKIKDSQVTDKTTVTNTNTNTHIKEKEQKNNHKNIDELLHRISCSSGGGNSSLILYKKTQISNLRQLMDVGKKIIKNGHSSSETEPIENMKMNLLSEVKDYFEELRKQIDRKEEQLLDNLEESIFIMKQNSIQKGYQKVSLSRGIDQCEREIDQYYKKIVEELEIDEFRKIIKAYSERFTFYIRKLETNSHIELKLPEPKQLMNFLQEIRFSIEEEGEFTFDETKNCSRIAEQTKQRNSTERLIRVHN